MAEKIRIDEEIQFLECLEVREGCNISLSEYRKLLHFFQDWDQQRKRQLANRAQRVLKHVHPYVQHLLGVRNQG